MSIETELTALKEGELLIVERVHEWAESHPKSALHGALEWNDRKAAYQHRLWQIRRLIAIHITYEGGERRFISLVVDRSRPAGGYRDLQDVLQDRTLYQIALADALRELERIQARYEHLRGLKPIWSAVRKVRTAAKTKGGGARPTTRATA
jgi:hypothetical protein